MILLFANIYLRRCLRKSASIFSDLSWEPCFWKYWWGKSRPEKQGNISALIYYMSGLLQTGKVGVKTEQPNQSCIWYNFTFQWGHRGVGDGSQSPGSTVDFTTWFVMVFAYLETVFLGVTVIPKPEGMLALRIIFFRFLVLGLMESLELRTLALWGQKHTYVLKLWYDLSFLWQPLPLPHILSLEVILENGYSHWKYTLENLKKSSNQCWQFSIPKTFTLKIRLLGYVCRCFACECLYTILSGSEPRKDYYTPGTRSRWLSAVLWALGINLGSLEEQPVLFNC